MIEHNSYYSPSIILLSFSTSSRRIFYHDCHLKSTMKMKDIILMSTGRNKCNDRSGQVEKKSQKVTGATEKDEEMP
jgi:hypothetical protein